MENYKNKKVKITKWWDNRYRYQYIGVVYNQDNRKLYFTPTLEIDYLGRINNNRDEFWFFRSYDEFIVNWDDNIEILQ